ncbi:hypothetical protein GX50_03400 [[Emmonsia] crescens]|uniref:Uncharacterized protein n=1 Tax=[Emmonsia] crescens TaxID=73230 RepID=A0A2B7ZKN6_9EURO|nr:hypothetical protein GX50_03400 [Emmonsia crescens]
MSQHQPRGLPVPQRLSSISHSSNETRSRQSNIPPLSGLDRIIAQHSQERHSYTANNNIIVDHDFLTKFGKTARAARQLGIPPHPSSAANRGEGIGDPIPGNLKSLNLGAAETGAVPQRQLRPRASSPLLGDKYQTLNHDPLPSFHAKAHPTLRQPESSSTTHSSRDPLKPPSAVSQQAQEQAQAQTAKHTQKQTPASISSRDLAFRNNAYSPNSSTESNLTNDDLDPLQPYLQDQKQNNKNKSSSSSSSSSKPKHRPPMIDLSKLFPKPSDPSVNPAVPLLSPHRMTMSPSPVSLRSDASSFGAQQRKLGSIHQTVNKLTKPPSSRELSALRKQYEQREQQQEQQNSEPSPYFSTKHHSHSFFEGEPQQQHQQQQQQQQQQHSQSSQSPPPPPQRAQSFLHQQPVKKEKEYFFQRGKRERKRREEEQQRQKQQEEEQLRQRQKQEQRDRERKQREQLEREQQQKKQEQVQQEKEQYFQRQKREKQRREEQKRRKEEPDQYEQQKKQEKKQREEEEQRKQQQQLQLQQQRQEELQSQHYQFPFHEKRTRNHQRKPPVEWFDGPEGHISSDDDNAERGEPTTQYSMQNPPSVRQPAQRESAYSHSSSNRISVHSNAMSGTSRASSRTLILSPAPEPAKKVTPELQSNTSPFISPATSRFNTFFHDWDLGSATPPSVGSPATAFGGLSRKSSKLTLNKSDLNESSVLCLSSSEDEAEEAEEVEVQKPAQQRGIRDSIATFDEGASEIFTAKAVAASRGPSSVSRVRNTSLPPPRISRDHLTSSSVRAPTYRPSNGIPTIAEPDSPPTFRSSASTKTTTTTNSSPSAFDFQLPVSRPHNIIKFTNRRSRVMAVTRQEEELLEVIRRHGGNMPPNFPLIDQPTPTPATSNTHTTNASRKSKSKSASPSPPPSTDRPPSSQHASGSIVDTSFLALSPSLPPPHTKGPADAASAAGSDSSRSHHALSISDSGGDHHSNPSPRVSLVYSDAFPLPSPLTSWVSPRTPTLGQYNQEQQQRHSQRHHQQQRQENTSPHSGSGGNPLHQHPQPLSSYPPTALPLSLSSPLSLPPSPLLSPTSPLTSATTTTGEKTGLAVGVVLPIEETKRHSRTRTDSSSAIVFGDGEEDDKSAAAVETTELPIWALGWSAETPGLAVVH